MRRKEKAALHQIPLMLQSKETPVYNGAGKVGSIATWDDLKNIPGFIENYEECNPVTLLNGFDPQGETFAVARGINPRSIRSVTFVAELLGPVVSKVLLVPGVDVAFRPAEVTR